MCACKLYLLAVIEMLGANEGQELVVAAIGTAQAQGALRQDAAFGTVVKLRNRTRRRRGVAAKDGLDDKVLVDGVRNGAAYARIGQLLAAVVDFHGELVGVMPS